MCQMQKYVIILIEKTLSVIALSPSAAGLSFEYPVRYLVCQRHASWLREMTLEHERSQNYLYICCDFDETRKLMTMNSLTKTILSLSAGMLATLVSFPLAGQNLWQFSKKHAEVFKDTWPQEHYIPATHNGKGCITAKDAQGRDLARYEIDGDRAVAGPFKVGSYFLFEVPSQKLPAGTFVDFNTTFTIEDGAPMDWILEVEDGGKWREGKTFRCYGPPRGSEHRHSSVYQTFKLEEGVNDAIRFRIRALDGYMRPSKGGEKEGGAMFVSGSYIGVMVNDFGSQAPKDTLKILSIGNSFTYYCGCPVMLKDIAWHEGHYIDMSATLKGGWTMGKHLSLETTNDMVAEGGYDYMILQDQSLVPGKVGRDPKGMEQMIKDMVAMATKVRTVSPQCKAVVENTWSYWKYDFGSFKSLDDFDKNARKGSKILAKAVEDAEVSPIADAFRIVRKERPDINLYHTDKHHQSPFGSYLKSCVNYLVLYGEPFGDSPSDCLLDPEIAAYLRSVAEKVVL